MATDVTLTNNNNAKGILLRGCKDFDFVRKQPAIAIPFVNTQPQNNVLFRFMGQQEQCSFSFVLADDGTNVATGGGTVQTKEEQIAYLRTYIYTEDFDVDWTLQDSIYFTGAGIVGVITDLSIKSVWGDPNKANANMTFMRGRIGALQETI